MKQVRRSIIAVLSCVLLVVLMAGCGKAPTFGTAVKDYDGFKELKEEELKLKGSDAGSLQAFLPKDGSSYSSEGYLSETGGSVEVKLRIVSNTTIDTVEGEKNYLAKYGDTALPDLKAAEESVSKIETTEDESTVYRTSLTTTPDFNGKFYSICQTEFVKKLDKGDQPVYVDGNIVVRSDKVGDSTEAVLAELSQYYGVEMYWDKEKAEEKAKKYNDNPPKYQRMSSGGFVFEIPRSWNQDYSATATGTSMYGPDGTATSSKNLVIATQYLSNSTNKYTAEECQDVIKKYMKQAFPGVTCKFTKKDSPIEDGKAFEMKLSKNGQNIHGYVVMTEFRMFMAATAANGSVSSSMQDILDNTFEKVQDYTSVKENKGGE